MDLSEFTNRYKYDPRSDKIGSGGFGDVFKVYDSILNKYVALKISKVEHENIRLKKEAEMASALPDHKNIAKYEGCQSFMTQTGVYDFGILQYYELGNFEELIFRQSISYEAISSILRQVLNGLEFLHSQKIIHRDMKPKNILMVITPDGEYVPKITDFGISKKLDTDKSQIFLHSLTGVGSLSFASPEQLKSTTIRRNTDLWSFGVVAYQAFTGQLPFTTGDEDSSSEAGRQELFRQISAGVIPEIINKIIEPWKSLILRCLVVDPAQRIQSAKECMEVLDSWTPVVRPPDPEPPQAPIANLDEFSNRYKYDPIKDKIAEDEGIFGDVFKAYDSILNKYVVLKISRVWHENERLRNYVSTYASIPKHPNILKYRDCHSFETALGEYDYGVQDYSELGNLDLLLNSQSLSYETISAILRQVINGLEFLHSQHLLHWHLVPQNILMFRRPDGEYVPKITDFGASSILHIGPACDSIPFYLNEIIGDAWIFSGKAMSHYYFESPEKLKQKPLTLNTDLWSFGVIAYRAFTGHLPFTTGDEDSASEAGKIELFCQIAAGEVPDGINKIIEPWKSLILKCLVVDPTKRIQSARECLNFLDTWGDTIRPVGVTRVFYPDPPQAPIANLDEFHNRYQYDPRTHKIGSGGFGDVFKAQDTNNDTLVAIKISKVEHEKIRLRKEVEMADALPNHENIAMYFGCYSFDTPMGEYDFAVLDYYSLGNLNQFLNNHSLSYENIGLILRQVLNGLDFLYSQKIIHQDLKPQNILIDIKPDGKYVPKIIDFGISRKQLFFHKEGQAYSVVMADPGPLAYTSPEQQKDEVIRQNTALWSFGLIACQVFADMGASHRPLRRILGLISKGIIPEIINKIIEPWRSLILKCLVVDPTKRIQSAKECLDFLDTWGDTIRPSGVARAFYPEPPPDEDPPAGSHSSYSGDTIIDVSLQPRIDEKPFSEGRHTKTQISPKPTAPPERNHTNDDAEKTEPYATTLCPPPQFGQTESYCVVCSREVPEGSQLCHEHIDVPLINPLIAELSKGIYEYPNNPSLYLSRSYAFANIGYYSRAIEDCNDVIRLSPEKADGHIARGSTLLKMGDFDSAIRAFDEAILLEPNSSVAYEERGKAYSHKGDSKRAEENYEKARWLRYLGR